MKILGISGSQNTGKTTLTTSIIREMVKRGYKVSTIKHTHHDFDMKDKDTWKHREAGAELVIGAGERTFITINEETSLEKIIKYIKFMKNLDFLIIEGFKSEKYAKISTTPVKDEYTITSVDVFNLNPDKIPSLVDLAEKRTYGLISNTNCGYCGYETCQGLAKAIVKGEASEDQCKMKKFYEVELFIEDKNIPLNPFVQDILKKGIIGMLSTLKTEDENIQGKVELLIRNGPE